MQQGGPPHGNQGMGGNYMPPNQQQAQQQQQQQHQPGINQQMGYYQQTSGGQYGQMNMPMGYQGGPPSQNIGQPQPMQQSHGVPPSHGQQPHPQNHSGMGQSQHQGMMPPMYGQPNQMPGRPQYINTSYGPMQTQPGSGASIGQLQGMPSQPQVIQQSNQVHQPSMQPSHIAPQQPQPSAQPPTLQPQQPQPVQQVQQQQPPQQPPTQQQPSQPPPSNPQHQYMGGLGQSSHTSSTGQNTTPGQSSGAQAASSSAKTSKKPIHLLSYSTDILENLDRYSVGGLCNIAKELIHELNHKTSYLCTGLKTVISERKPTSGIHDVDANIDYCLMLFDKLTEIRIRIDTKMGSRAFKPEEFLKLYEDPTEPENNRPDDLKEKMERFNKNSEHLTALSHDLKLLDWMATVSDPSLLKKVDKMSCFSQNQQ